MSRNATHVADAPSGIIRIYVPGADDQDGRKLARNLACKVHGGVGVGKTPAASKASRGHIYDFAPVQVTRGADGKVLPSVATKARKATQAPSVSDVTMAARIAELESLLAQLKATTPVKAPKAPREIPPAVKARMDKAAAVTCKTCKDLGVVRKAGPKAGRPYVTAKGAAEATAKGNSVPCHSHKRAA